MMACRTRTVLLLLGCAATGACAHAPVRPVDPVEDARSLLADLATTPGPAACAAVAVMGDLSFLRPSSRTRSGAAILGAQATPRDHSLGGVPLNLSQASAGMSQTWEFARSVDANARAGRLAPGGAPQASSAGLTYPSKQSGGAAPTLTVDLLSGWARSYFASGWALYFDEATPEQTRHAVLDALTSWSLSSPQLLRDYHTRFIRASRRECGGE